MNDKSSGKSFPQRRYARLHSYDYTWQGAYFVTICTHEKHCIFGKIENGLMNLNPYGVIVQSCWKDLRLHYCDIKNDVFVVMPNHVHGIITIQDVEERSGFKPDPTKRHSLTEIVRGFKTFSSRKINELRNSQGTSVWQASFYEHVIRGEGDYLQTVEYITYNPVRWETDRENPNTIKKSSSCS